MRSSINEKTLHIRALFFLSVMLFISCSTSSHIKSSSKGKLDYRTFGGIEFLVSQNRIIEVEQCGLESVGEGLGSELDTIEIKRKFLKRGELIRGLTQKSNRGYTEFNFLVCINRSGNVALTKLTSSSEKLSRNEQNKLLFYVMDYVYAEDTAAECLECGNLTFVINKIVNF